MIKTLIFFVLFLICASSTAAAPAVLPGLGVILFGLLTFSNIQSLKESIE